MIMATMLLITSTTIRLFRMLNQCTRPPGMFRYASQRDAQLMSDSSQYTSKVYTILESARKCKAGQPLFDMSAVKPGEMTQCNLNCTKCRCLQAVSISAGCIPKSHCTQYAPQQCTAHTPRQAWAELSHRQLADLTFGDLLWLRWAVIIAYTRQWLHTGTSLALDTAGHHLKANYLHSSDWP